MTQRNSIGAGLSEQERRAFGHWLAGFIDGEGFFTLHVCQSRQTEGYRAGFGITLRQDDAGILQAIKSFLGCGAVRLHKACGTSNPSAMFQIRDADDLNKTVFPFLEEFPLRSKKSLEIPVWQEGVLLSQKVKHRRWVWRSGWRNGALPKWTTKEGQEFNKLAASLTATRGFKTDVPRVEEKPGTADDVGNWIAGLTDAEGCLALQYKVEKGVWGPLTSYQMKLRSDDRPTLERVQAYFGKGTIGAITKDAHNPRLQYWIRGVANIYEGVIPVFEKYPLRAKKRRDYLIWRKGVEIAYQVQQRPRIPKRYGGHGYIAKWTDAERAEFTKLCEDIKRIRAYQTPEEMVVSSQSIQGYIPMPLIPRKESRDEIRQRLGLYFD